MIKINAENIHTKLGAPYYLILGSDPYLRYFAQTELLGYFKQQGFDEQLTFMIDNHLDWQTVYDSCQAINLFSSKTLIQLDFADNSLSAPIAAKLATLTALLNADIVLIITLTKITKAQENAPWYKTLSHELVVVNCTTPDIHQLPLWIKNYLQQQNMVIDPKAIELLCYYYEGNLLALTQFIEQLKLLYPEKAISYAQIEDNINDATVFTPYHWLDAMLANKAKRAMHILQQLNMNDVEPLILLRTVQRELILVINLKKASAQTSFKQLYDTYKIWQNRRALYTDYLQRVSLENLYHTLAKLTEIEIALKNDYSLLIWEQLSLFTMQFMGMDNLSK
ncbi:DNA polymerase III subunit delta [Orbaceae bacterium ESL0727]|nr:DNA polymerase III subunit delta [Orbaceae bacterium ESL0727]